SRTPPGWSCPASATRRPGTPGAAARPSGWRRRCARSSPHKMAASQTAPGPFLLIVAWSFLILAVTVVMTIKRSSRKRWVRTGLIVAMAMSCIGYLINVTSGLSLGTLLGLGLSIAVIVCLFQQDSRDYLDQ